jgi:hypothetical protein
MSLEGSRPVRPPRRLVIEISQETLEAIKLRAAQKRARNMKAYILDLLRADDVQVAEPEV